jgi:hypothetical protein
VSATNATVSSITVMPPTATLANSTGALFSAMGVYSDGSSHDVTSLVTWSSSDTTVATVSNTAGSLGAATAAMPGSATVSATLGGISGSASLTVTSATLKSILVTPVNPTLAQGEVLQLSAVGTFSDGSTQDLTASATWSSTYTALATVSTAMGTSGLVTAVGTASFGTYTAICANPPNCQPDEVDLTKAPLTFNTIFIVTSAP